MKRITFALALILSLTLAAASSHAEVDWFEFKADYIAGSKDPNKQMRRGTEVMRLMAHDGKLYAALGIFMQNYSDGPLTGAQILRKTSPTVRGSSRKRSVPTICAWITFARPRSRRTRMVRNSRRR